MAIISGLCLIAKRDFLMGVHAPTDQYRVALYRQDASLSPDRTTTYTPQGEVQGEGYQPGGQALSGYQCILDQGAAVMGWQTPPVWKNATISAWGALIYNASKGNRAVVIVDFGRCVASTSGDYRLLMPPVTAETALIRIL
jgi:hypothetical protein